jgi:hypothetical protein
MNITKQQLKDKKIISFESEEHMGHAQWDKRIGHFAIFFNGACIKATQTFAPIKAKLESLFEQHSLTIIED